MIVQFIGSNREGVGVGDDKWSWAYDGDRTCLWSGQYRVFGEGSISWGKQWENGDVVGICVICCSIHLILCVAGVLVDMNQRKMSFTLDGIYTEPMGVAFESFSYSGGLMPGLTCSPGVPLTFDM